MKNDNKMKGIILFTNDESSDDYVEFMEKLSKVDATIHVMNIIGKKVDGIQKAIKDLSDINICIFFISGRLQSLYTTLVLRLLKDEKITVFVRYPEDIDFYVETYKLAYNDCPHLNNIHDIDLWVPRLNKYFINYHTYIGIISDNKKFVMDLFDNTYMKAKKILQSQTPTPVIIRKECHVPFSCCDFTGLLKVWVAPSDIDNDESKPNIQLENDPKVAFVNEILSIKYDDRIITYHYIKPSTITDFSKIDLYDEIYVDLNSSYKTLVLPKNKDMHVDDNVHPFTSLDLCRKYDVLTNLDGSAESEFFKTNHNVFSNEFLNQIKNMLNYFYDMLYFQTDKDSIDKYGLQFSENAFVIRHPNLKNINLLLKDED